MSINIPYGQSDEVIEQIRRVLAAYQADHLEARIDIYRQNSVSVRIRIVDPSFTSYAQSGRHDRVWSYLERLPEEVVSEISLLVLLTPEEQEGSLANIVFEEPEPSSL